MKSQKRNSRARGAKGGLSLSTDHQLSLSGFRSVEQPDMVALKQVYSDFRTMTASTNQAEYVYRLNSLFDPDFTGVGGQPDGFDQWKALYTNYRVVACGVEVEAVGGNGFGLLAIAPTSTSTAISSAEEVAGLRHAQSQVFTTTQRAKVKALYRVGEVFGYPDETILASDSCTAACTTNPGSQAFLHVAAETSGASDIVYFRVLLTYYARFEVPFVLIDSATRHRRRMDLACLATDSSATVAPAVTSGEPSSDLTRVTVERSTGPSTLSRPPMLSLASQCTVGQDRLGGLVKR